MIRRILGIAAVVSMFLITSCANMWVSAGSPDPCTAAANAGSHDRTGKPPGEISSPELYNLQVWCENYREYEGLKLTRGAAAADSIMSAKYGENYLGPWTP